MNQTCRTLLAKQGWAHKWCSPMYPLTRPSKSRATNSNLHTAALWGYGVYPWGPTWSDERYGGVTREGQRYPCWWHDKMMMKVREILRRPRCTNRSKIRILNEPLLRSTFTRLVPGPLRGIESSYFLLASLLSRVWHWTISRHRIILVSPRFSTFVSFVHLRLFSTSKIQADWCKVSAKSAITWSCSSVGFRCSLWVKILPGLYRFLPPTSCN